MEREAVSGKFSLGSNIPAFNLKATDGNSYGDDYLKAGKTSLVIFTCNHCPYVKGSEQMLNESIADFLEKGLRVVAICSNDSVTYPDDSFDKMREKAQELNLPYPYLHDETQDVARLFDAACTPECYLFDGEGKLVFHGTINNSPGDPSAAKTNYIKPAIEQVMKGQAPEPNFVHPIGCSIKWRTN